MTRDHPAARRAPCNSVGRGPVRLASAAIVSRGTCREVAGSVEELLLPERHASSVAAPVASGSSLRLCTLRQGKEAGEVGMTIAAGPYVAVHRPLGPPSVSRETLLTMSGGPA